MSHVRELLSDLQLHKISPKELLEKYILKVKENQPLTHSLIYFNEKQVREEFESGAGPFHGLPLVISEVIKWQGTPTTFGSLLLKDQIAEEDSSEAKRLKNAGLTLIGKGNVGEFGLGYETENLLCERSLNPFDHGLTLGGSGGGVAGAILSGMAPWGIGTDVSGALRIGASCTGLYALLPSRGRVPLVRRHLLPYTERLFYRKGPIAKNPHDLALLFNYLSGSEPSDSLSLHHDFPDYVKSLKKGPTKKTLRIGTSLDLGFLPVDKEVEKIFNLTVQRFKDEGHIVEKAPLKFNHDLIEHFKDVFATDRYLLISQLLDEAGDNQKLLSDTTIRWMQYGKEVSGYRYALAVVYQGWIEETYNKLFAEYDLLLTPTMPVAPWNRGQAPSEVNASPLDPYIGLSSFLFPLNMSGNPALVFPAGHSSSGAPIGMQLISSHYNEETLFSAFATNDISLNN